MKKILFILLLTIIAIASCSRSSVQVTHTKHEAVAQASLRRPAQDSYQSCQPITEELLIDEVDYSKLDKSFDNVKEQVFKNNCASCHFGKDSYLPHLDDYASTMDYVNVQNPVNSKLLKAVESGKMPPSTPLSQRDYEGMKFFRAWIMEGAVK